MVYRATDEIPHSESPSSSCLNSSHDIIRLDYMYICVYMHIHMSVCVYMYLNVDVYVCKGEVGR